MTELQFCIGPITEMNFATFDLNLLRVFDALMRERSVTRAGASIGLSQPAVSNALSRLRHHFADELFVRRANDMVPTPKAEGLAPTLQKALSDIEGAMADQGPFRPEEIDETFTFAGADFFSVLFLPRLYRAIAPVAPRATLRMIESATVDVQTLLRDSAIDMALERDLGEQPDWVSSTPLMRSSFCVVAARDNRAIAAAGIESGEALPMDLFCAMPQALRTSDGTMHGVIDTALERHGRARPWRRMTWSSTGPPSIFRSRNSASTGIGGRTAPPRTAGCAVRFSIWRGCWTRWWTHKKSPPARTGGLQSMPDVLFGTLECQAIRYAASRSGAFFSCSTRARWSALMASLASSRGMRN